jgi:hypothetical protein
MMVLIFATCIATQPLEGVDEIVKQHMLFAAFVKQLGPASLPFLHDVLLPILQFDPKLAQLRERVNGEGIHKLIVDDHTVTSATKSITVSSMLLPAIAEPRFNGQCGQDWLVVNRLFDDRRNASANFYVDLAANDAITISNTYALDRLYGWSGICIEANSFYWRRLAAHRTCNVVGAAVGSQDGIAMNFTFQGPFGGLIGDRFDNKPNKVAANAQKDTVLTLSLLTILTHLHAPKTIQYLSLDVEGAELLIMKDFPYHEYRFEALTIERPGKELSELLAANHYVLIGQTSLFDDELWLHEDFVRSKFGGVKPSMHQLFTDVPNAVRSAPCGAVAALKANPVTTKP